MSVISSLYNIHEKAFGIAKITQKELALAAGIDEDTLIGFKESPVQWVESKNPSVNTVLKLERAAGKL